MSMEVDEGKGDSKELLEQAIVLAKGLEIIPSKDGVVEVIKHA